MQKRAYLLFLLLVAAKSPAFQAKIAPQSLTLSNGILPSANISHPLPTMAMQTIHPGVCNAVSINGCGCPFCVQLRNIGR
ncbi:hypothetical protein ABRZ24_18340 [Brenneria populi]|uniref:Uncharacterized protein n=1 Tax=Brenneria populi TaxID=1505588 RepID=A0ABU6JV86_9GAMM|nr:hypothetical protein [Brenneria populi Li et al. 2015]